MSGGQAKGRALVVEDDRSWQQILEEILLDAGLEVDIADSVESAVEQLRHFPHRLAVVDLSLGGHDHTNQDGLRVLDAVRLHDPGCVALLLTGYATVEVAVSSLTEHGALTCLQKAAFRRVEFCQLVRQALAKAPPMEAIRGSEMILPDRRTHEESAVIGDSLAAGAALVVEDDAGWRNIFSELLTEAGYQVEVCGSFGEALGHLRRERYDLAVVDLSLSPDRASDEEHEGYKLLGNARQTPTLVVSGTASPEDIERAYAAGAFVCLEKQNFDRRAFWRAVEGARAQPCGALDGLTEREREVLALLAQGVTNNEIAEVLFITNNTVKRHLKAIFEKLDVHTRSAAVAKAVNAGLVRRDRPER